MFKGCIFSVWHLTFEKYGQITCREKKLLKGGEKEGEKAYSTPGVSLKNHLTLI